MTPSTRRAVLFLVAVALLSLIVVFSAAPAQAAPAPKINWSPCFKDFGPSYECAIVQVPLDYSKPKKAAINLSLVRLPATDPARKIGSLFLNPGGPGGSGVDFALGAGPYLYTEEVRARFDIVGFDPRGISRSTALRCFGNPRQWTPYFTPFAFPMTREEEAWWISADRYLDHACDLRGGKLIDYMTTANVARDLDRLRQAVGDEKLTYAGFSYGSYLGVMYANLFPDKVRAVVVDGVLDPVAWSTGAPGESATLPFSTRLRSDAGAMATLEEFFRLCDAGAANCAFAPDAAARFDALAAKLLAEPLVVQYPDGTVEVFTYQNLISLTLGAMYDSFSWPDLAGTLAAIEAAVSPAAVGAAVHDFWVESGYITKRGFPRYQNYLEGFPAVACADSDNPDNYEAWWQAGIAADAAYGYFGRLWTYASSVCAEWRGVGMGRYMGPFTAETANPVLVVGNFHDPATRYEGAVTVASLLPNSRLLSLDAWGHCSLFFSTCADNYVAEYLLTGAVPPEGTVCNQDWVPFSTPILASSTIAGGKPQIRPALVIDAIREAAR